MAPQRLFLFGDQTIEKLPAVTSLVRLSRASAALRRFLREATDVIQNEIPRLSPHSRRAFPTFDDVLSLAEKNGKTDETTELVPTVLITIARLGELIVHVENNPSILEPSSDGVLMLGLCTGLLPAAATAWASTLTDLHKIGLEIVRISVRLGDCIAERSRTVEATPGTWAYSIIGTTPSRVQSILDNFHPSKGIPKHRQAFLAVTSRTWTTVFGPPSTLSELWAFSPELELTPKLKLVADGAVHAPHLPSLDPDTIIGDSPIFLTPYPSKAKIISTSSCLPYTASDMRSLLSQMIADIGENTLRLTESVDYLLSSISKDTKDVDLVVVGPTAHTRLLQIALQDASIRVNTISEPDIASPAQDLRGGSGKVAIVGMSGRFPGSESIQEFWANLQMGVDFSEKIIDSRFDLDENYDATGEKKNSMTTQHGCFLRNPGHFDCRLFNISPREALQMDPVQRLLLMVSYEAMEMAGYSADRNPSSNAKRIASYMAQTTDDWRENLQIQGIDIYFVPGYIRAFTPGRINYHFKFEGASHSVDAACSGSSTTVQLACQALLSRECDTALAGGGQVNAAPGPFAGCGRGGFLSPTGNCKTFSDDADGYCRGEAAGVVVLKRLEDAIADNDNILTVVSGSMRTYSANAASITQPHGDSQVNICSSVLKQANADPQDVGYVEMHGTGTQAGDSIEMQSIARIFGGTRSAENPLVVGAVKANVGHSEAGAGITSLIKCVLMMQNPGRIPPQPGMPIKLNHKFPPLDKMHIRIADGTSELRYRPHGDGKRKMLLNNFDASGGNTCLILEEGPAKPRKRKDPRTFHIVVCSARTPRSFQENKRQLLEFLQANLVTALPDLAYSTTARRMHDSLRASYVVKSTEELVGLLTTDLEKGSTEKTATSGKRQSIIFAFTGQGSVYPGMGRQLFHTNSSFRDMIISYQTICDSLGLPQVVDLIARDDSNIQAKGPVQTALALLFVELALANLWRLWGTMPDLLIGHSLGEYAAMCIAGVLSISDTIYLVGRRAKLVEEKCVAGSHAMLMVSASAEAISNNMTDNPNLPYEVSCYNAPDMTIIGGLKKDLEIVQRAVKQEGMRGKLLDIPYGFHSAQMDPILEDLESIAQGVHFGKPLIPIASTFLGKVITEAGTFGPSYLAGHTRQPVNFISSLQDSKTAGLIDENSLWIEVGPNPVCLGFARSTLKVPNASLYPSIKSSEDTWKTMSTCAAALHTSKHGISWADFHREYLSALTLLELPTYSFDVKDYWTVWKQGVIGDGSNQSESKRSVRTNPRRKMLRSTCLQYVDEESYNGDQISVTFSALTSELRFFDAVQGHRLMGSPICPASMFCDMALTAVKYVRKDGKAGGAEPEMSISKMEITSPLTVQKEDPEQIVQVTAQSIASQPIPSFLISFRSVQGTTPRDHGTCIVQCGTDESWKSKFSRVIPFVKGRIADLLKSGTDGSDFRLQRPIVYKLFAALVEYSDRYQGMTELFLDRDYKDAVANVQLRSESDAGEFTLSPYWTDSIIHLAGFILNADINLPKDVAFIASGFEDFLFFDKLSSDGEYKSYVSVQPSDEKKDVMVGDVFVFQGGRLVALCAGLFFHKMPRKLLSIVLGLDEKPTVTQPTPNTIKVAAEPGTVLQVNSEQPIPVKGKSSDPESEPITKTIIEAVASECGLTPEEMDPTTSFADVGVDSLMSIAITSAVKKKTGVDLGASFFNDYATVADVKSRFEKQEDAQPRRSVASPEPPPRHSSIDSAASAPDSGSTPLSSLESGSQGTTSPNHIPASTPSTRTSDLTSASDTNYKAARCTRSPSPKPRRDPVEEPPTVNGHGPKQYTSNAVLIRGRASSKEPPLFLMTDGAGSATAYIHFPALTTGNRIFALESPFLHDPSSYNCTVEEASAMYLAAIRKISAHGPYLIGGWSAGAIYAYEVVRQLLALNETIAGLFLIDMRVPRRMPDALEPSKALIQSAGVFTGIERSGPGNSAAAERLKDHLVRTVGALVNYEPVPLDVGRRPKKNFIIWAQHGLSESKHKPIVKMDHFEDTSRKVASEESNIMEDADTGLKSWFYDRRSAFGPNGWDALLGDVECSVVEGADHFSMVVPPKVKQLGKILDGAIKTCLTSGK